MPLESETASIPYADPPEVVKVRVRRLACDGASCLEPDRDLFHGR